jgi:HEPN domain-containing protein
MRNPEQEARRWFQQALSDFAFLEVARQARKYDTCCFLAQQTAEKALKAYLFHQGEELIFTHSIFRLCEMAAHYDPSFRDIREQVKLLDFYYVERAILMPWGRSSRRSSTATGTPNRRSDMARMVIEAVQTRLSSESGSEG